MVTIYNTKYELQKAYFWLRIDEMRDDATLLGRTDVTYLRKQELGDWLMSEVIGNLDTEFITNYLRKVGYQR